MTQQAHAEQQDNQRQPSVESVLAVYEHRLAMSTREVIARTALAEDLTVENEELHKELQQAREMIASLQSTKNTTPEGDGDGK